MGKVALFLFLSLTCVGDAVGKNIQDIWLSMPDSVIPFIDRSHRIEMLDFANMGVAVQVDNQLRGKSRMDTLTADFIGVGLTERSSMQIKLLPFVGGDSILCVVHSYQSDAVESTVAFYDGDWERISIPLPQMPLPQRPDTMGQETYARLLSCLEPHMSYAELSPADDCLRMGWSLPLLTKDERRQMEALQLQRTYCWNGTKFE